MKNSVWGICGIVLLCALYAGEVSARDKGKDLSVHMRERGISSVDGREGAIEERNEVWISRKTAIIISDMWDKHWCDCATKRVVELALAMDEMLRAARAKGITIIHAPSDCMDYYADAPGRKRVAKYYDDTLEALADGSKLPSEKEAAWPFDPDGEGCPNPDNYPHRVWSKQTDLLTIADEDLISDSGAEIVPYLKKHGIENVILVGVHTNMCVMHRSFGLRAMTRMGMNVVLMRDMTDLMYDPQTYPYTTHFGGLERMVEYIERYVAPTITSADITGGKPFVFREMLSDAEKVAADRARNINLPADDYHFKAVANYVEKEPDYDYLHASAEAHDRFRDIKFSVRIHWGIYSILQMNGESWGFLNLSKEEKQKYNELYKEFNPTGFDAYEWMDLFARAGLQAIAFTTKHHEGFSMYDTATRVRRRVNYLDPANPVEECNLAYSIMETPFGRDITKELCDAAHARGIKVDLYYSHPDWYDADFRPYNSHPLATPDYRDNTSAYGNIRFDSRSIMTSERTPEETRRMVMRHREQLRELLTNYGKVDMLCLDQWLGKDVWEETKNTIKMVRRLQPDIMIRCRGIGNYGDFYTPEGFVPGSKENTNMPWMVIYPLGASFSYDKNGENYKGAGWIIENLVDAVAKGGSFMVGIGPDGNGKFHPEAVAQLEETGRWLAVNGEGIYNTKAREVWSESDIRLTQSKDGCRVYAFVKDLSLPQIALSSVSLRPESRVRMLGYGEPLSWKHSGEGVRVDIPAALREGKDLPCGHMWTLVFEL